MHDCHCRIHSFVIIGIKTRLITNPIYNVLKAEELHRLVTVRNSEDALGQHNISNTIPKYLKEDSQSSPTEQIMLLRKNVSVFILAMSIPFY